MSKDPILLSLCLLLIISSVSHGQSWKSMTRQKKDSVIFCHFDEGKKYTAMGFGGTFLSGGWHGFSYKLEPTIGYFPFNRQLLSCSVLLEQAKTQYNDEYKKSQQLRVGISYRYYLPERKILHLFFGQASIYGGKFSGQQNPDGIEESISVNQVTISVSAGISFSINKYNLELALSHDYELLNQRIINDYFAGGTLGLLRLSYSF